MTKEPVIGIAAGSKAGGQPYADVIRRSGGNPRLILPEQMTSVDETLRLVGGLLLSDGKSIDPTWHGQWAMSDEGINNATSRDAVEMLLIKAALEEDMPVLGVSRGLQVLNLAMGGDLAKEVAGHGPSGQDGEEESSYHRIYISPGSKLAAIVGSGGFVRVNSRHRRGIKEAQKSPLLLASAYSLEDGVIEAVESPSHDWVVGVQFQPERRLEQPPHFDRLFQGLVERARG